MNLMNNGTRKICMSLNQARKEAAREHCKAIYVWETVWLPSTFYELCRARQIAIYFTR